MYIIMYISLKTAAQCNEDVLIIYLLIYHRTFQGCEKGFQGLTIDIFIASSDWKDNIAIVTR